MHLRESAVIESTSCVPCRCPVAIGSNYQSEFCACLHHFLLQCSLLESGSRISHRLLITIVTMPCNRIRSLPRRFNCLSCAGCVPNPSPDSLSPLAASGSLIPGGRRPGSTALNHRRRRPTPYALRPTPQTLERRVRFLWRSGPGGLASRAWTPRSTARTAHAWVTRAAAALFWRSCT